MAKKQPKGREPKTFEVEVTESTRLSVTVKAFSKAQIKRAHDKGLLSDDLVEVDGGDGTITGIVEASPAHVYETVLDLTDSDKGDE